MSQKERPTKTDSIHSTVFNSFGSGLAMSRPSTQVEEQDQISTDAYFGGNCVIIKRELMRHPRT